VNPTNHPEQDAVRAFLPGLRGLGLALAQLLGEELDRLAVVAGDQAEGRVALAVGGGRQAENGEKGQLGLAEHDCTLRRRA